MNRKIIVIEGYLAAGKSTFARQCSKAIQVPYLMKDTLKMALCRQISVTDRSASSRFSAVTFDAMMYVTERLFETGNPVILEGNFTPRGIKSVDEAGVIRQLLEQYGYTPLTFKFSGDTRVLHRRFMEREKTDERGQVNKIGFDIPYETFDQWCRNLDAFDIGGRVIRVDTTDLEKVCFEAHIESAKRFIG